MEAFGDVFFFFFSEAFPRLCGKKIHFDRKIVLRPGQGLERGPVTEGSRSHEESRCLKPTETTKTTKPFEGSSLKALDIKTPYPNHREFPSKL